MSVLKLGNSVKPNVEKQQVSDIAMQKARKEYYECIQFLTIRGVKVTEAMALSIKEDIISHRNIMEF